MATNETVSHKPSENVQIDTEIIAPNDTKLITLESLPKSIPPLTPSPPETGHDRQDNDVDTLNVKMTLEQEAQRLLNLISTVSADIHRMPRDNLDHMLETLNILLKKLECYKIDLDTLIDSSKAYPKEEEMKNNLSSLNKKLSSLLLRTEHQIAITKEAKDNHEKHQAEVERYKNTLIGVEEWLKPIILSLEGFNSKPVDEKDAQKKIDELQKILDQLESKEKTVKEIHVDCEQYGAQHGDIQRYIKELLLGLSSNIQVIRENQNIIRIYLEKLREAPKEVVSVEAPKQEVVVEKVAVETVKPETQAMSTQTFMEQPTDNIMVIQSMNADGETIQIYNVPCSHEEGKEDDRNVIVEAKYIRSHSGEPKRASELVLKNVPKHFETTFVEPDETTTEIIVDPDGSKRIIVRKLTKTTQQIVQREQYEDGTLPEHIRSQLGLSGTTHDVIVGTPDNSSFEQHQGITESSIHAVIEHVSHRIIKKTRKIIKKIVIIDGQEHITEEVIEEPDEVEEFSEDRPAIEYDVSEAVLIEPAEETIEIEIIKKEDEPEAVVPQPEEVTVVKTTKITTETVNEPKPISKEPETVCEGENQPEQVFEIDTEAPVDLIAYEVEKLAPIEDITNIWPYATPHIASQSTVTEITEQPAPTQQDILSQSIWPQNLTIGSNIDFNEYSFDRTIEKSSDYLDNDSFVTTTDPGLEDVQKEIDVRLTEEEVKQPEPVVVAEIIEPKPVEEVKETIAVKPEETQPEPKVESEPQSIIESVKETEPELEAISGTQTIVVSPVESPPTSPKSPTPQMARITIVKTMTFLEQEKINAQATMTIETDNIEDAPADQSTISETEYVIEEKVEIPIEEVLDESTISQADRSLPEEIIEQTIITEEKPIEVEEKPIQVVEQPVEMEEKPQPKEPAIDVTDKSILSRTEDFIASEASSPPSEIDPTTVIDGVKIETKLQTPSAPVEEILVPVKPQAEVQVEPIVEVSEFVEETIVEQTPEIVEQIVETIEQPDKSKEKVASQIEMFITSEIENSTFEKEQKLPKASQPEKASETEVVSPPIEPKPEPMIAEDKEQQDQFDTYQVTLKVDPSEVTKVNVNLTEQVFASSEPEQEVTIVEAPVIAKAPEPVSDVPTGTGYEADKTEEESQSSDGKKKKKKSKKKQKVKPEDVPSAIPNTTEASNAGDQTELVSTDNEAVMPEEEHLPEGREEILSPDESYRSLSEIDDTTVKILEESVITDPNETIEVKPDSGIIYPGEVIEVTYVGDTEQQTDEPQKPLEPRESSSIKEPISIETKETQVEVETSENQTQMSPREDEIPKKETSETSIQTIITEFIESESQTIADVGEKPQQEQEIQTEPTVDDISKQEFAMQTTPVKTASDHVQTEDTQGSDEANRIGHLMVTEIILKACQSAEPTPEPIVEKPVVEEKELVPTSTVETQTKKDKKKKEKKPKDKKGIEIETTIEVQQPDRVERSQVAVTTSEVENLGVQVTVERPLASAPPDPNSAVMQRLNDIMNLETSEQPKTNQSFALSQNLNNLINNVDQQGFEIVPWNEVQYLIDANIENRRINNNSDTITDYIVEEPEDAEEKLNDSLQKVEHYVNILPEIVASGEDKIAQKTIIIITKVIVTCLEQIETRIYYTKQNKPREAQNLDELERLDKVLVTLKDNVGSLRDPALAEDISRCISTLQQHVELDKDVQRSVNKDIENYYVDLSNADDAIKHLQNETIMLEDKYKYLIQSDTPIEEKLKHLEALEFTCKENKKLAARLIKMKNINDEQVFEIRSCYDRTKDSEHNIRLERRKLIQLANLSEEYVQTLNEFSQITLIANSLVDKTTVTNTLDHLHNEIQRHRKFFVNLNHCRNILESLERNLDPETRTKHSQLHNALHGKATVILEKAGDRSQKLSLAASRWTVLDKRMKNEEQWLQVAEQRVPDLSTVTSADYEQYITLYQSLNTDIATHQSKMLHNYETAIKLQELICAPNLETKCNDALTKLVKIKEDVNIYLKKLLHFRQMWNEYNLNADKLEHWMNHVDDELNRINIPENFMEYPVENMRNFWEIKAQYEFNNQIHNNVCDSFDKSLKVISIADDKLQLQFYAQLEDRWQGVSNRIDAIKNQITENISSTCPSYNDKLSFLERELDELMFIIENTKGIIRNPEELNLYIERLIVLKSRVIVVENELVTIGFISTNDTEKVGELCEKAHKVSLNITEELEHADLCKGRLNTLRQEIGNIRENQIDFYENLGQFENAAKLESVAIEKALCDCQTMRENLVLHWQDIMRVRHLLHVLPTSLRMSVSPVDVEKEISQLEDDYVHIEKRLCDVENLLKTRYNLWKRFEKQLETIQQSIEETDFMVDLLTVHGNIDYDRLQKATERLEGLYDDLGSREDAVQDLKVYAQPLMEFCEDHVAQDIENTMQKAVVKWNETNDNLKQICDKYKGAVRLWRKYCDDSSAIRNVIDQHFGGVDGLMEDKSLEEIQVLENTLAIHREKLSDLQKLAAQISDSVGADSSIQIESDIQELDRQLADIVEWIGACKNLSDNSNKLQAARKVTVSKSHNLIDNVTEDLRQQKPTNDEDQLQLLRSHLLNLAVIEHDLKNQKSSPAMSGDDSNSIVDTLNSLQKLFKETITEYNKLSSQLVYSSDSTVIFKIWRDYLNHVRSFLQSSIPSDYEVLKEQLHLCKVHQNLISNQRNALMHKISVENSSPESLDEFKNQHVEILTHLFERQTEIEGRINAWEKYRKGQSDLLESIDDIEREKSLLQLKQIYLKAMPKTKTQIDGILSKVVNAENEIVSLKNNQASLLNFIDDVSSSALRLEFSSTHQRLANIRASLETWIGYLKRVQELNKDYDVHVKSVQDNYQRQLNFLSSVKSDVATNVGNSKQQLEVLKDKQKSLAEIKTDLENLNALKDEMKDYISTYDIKMMRQSLWILWQQYTDLNYEYSLLLNQIEERICLQTEFVIRYENLMFWLNETEGRLMEASSQKYQSSRSSEDDPYMKHYANNILEDFALKEYDRKWIQSVGSELLLFYSAEQNFDSPEKIDIECKLVNMNTKWNNIKLLYDSRSRKINEIKTTYYNLEARIAEIRAWLFETEKELLKPYVFEEANKASFEKQLIEYEKIQRSVENNSANVAEILNLSEMVLSELRNLDMEMTVKNLDLAINNISYRWKKLCESLVQRKRTLLSLWNTLEELTMTTKDNAKWLTDCDELCNSIEAQTATKMTKEAAQENIRKLNENLERIATHTQTFSILEKLYNTVLTANVDVNNIRKITTETRRILIIWKTIGIRITSLKTLLDNYIDEFSAFEHQYEHVILNLTQADVEITNIKHLKMYEGTDDELERLNNVKKNYGEIKRSIDAAEAARKSLMETSSEAERLKLKSMSDEYFKLFNSIKLNYDEMLQQYENLTKQEAIQERDAAVQVNTLQAQASVSPKDAYKYEIQTAINEFRNNIESLEKIVSETGSNETGGISKTASQKVGKNIAACESSLELIKYLNSLLINDYACNDDEAHTKNIEELYDRLQVYLLLWSSKKETKTQIIKQHSESDWKSCPFCSQRNWQQMDNDLWRLEQWLHVAENERRTQSSPPSNIEELEDVIQDHREFLLNLDSHKSIISSLNNFGEHLALHTSDTEKATNLRKRLHDDNIRWDQVCQHASVWQRKLQQALIGNREFHKIINEFNLWLEDTERKIKNFEPVDLASERSVMEAKFSRFKELKCEIERCEPRVISLQENSAQLLKSSNDDMTANETYVKLTDLSVKLQSLRRLTALYVIKLGAVLGYDEAYINAPLHSSHIEQIGSTSSSVRTLAQSENMVEGDAGEEEDINYTVLNRSYRFLGRVMRASLPIQALMLLLLGAVTLIPLPNDDDGGYSCLLVNTFGRIGEPMLRYRNGNPPI